MMLLNIINNILRRSESRESVRGEDYLVSKREIKHLNKMASIIRSSKGIDKDVLVIKSDMSIAWAEKLCKYIPILYKDIEYNKQTRRYNTLHSLSAKK